MRSISSGGKVRRSCKEQTSMLFNIGPFYFDGEMRPNFDSQSVSIEPDPPNQEFHRIYATYLHTSFRPTTYAQTYICLAAGSIER